jgi:D-alanyl-D-alanine carboxypeptidase
VTAADMAKITAYALKNPVFADIVSTKRKTLRTDGAEKPLYLKNHNKLLWLYESALGVKTGFTKKAGRTLVSYAKKDGRELICVSLNDPDDWNDHIKLYNRYFLNSEFSEFGIRNAEFGIEG